ncbi:KAP family P-loop NTPase fold protein [Macrococcus equipercicus]|uniref:KAP NTPase domain-containing protein n=1 Tax=Macrococcus equipercicus TaxID=69967 RepID=A0A9Q9BVV7_9STAP|nr:P-loop NTPase fold protein [Macrococcus equipercicus]UTH14177.1 hypothetical protein KFV11_02085 [Macrococcus equipercicus]
MKTRREYGLGTNDTPISESKHDKFEIIPYVEALGEFIEYCETPITIALQGGWGTGKTSFINFIDNYLRENNRDKIITFKFNTWQYSQFNLEHHIGISFLKYLINEIGVQENEKERGRINKILNGLSKAVSGGTITLGPLGYTFPIGKDAETQEDGNELTTLDIAQMISVLRKTMQEVVNNRLSRLGKDGRIVIFIDDLDRLSPEIAVKLLEVIKLFVDVEGCVFVLAVDNKVIEQGVKHIKNTSNEKTKSFMEKMIQVPFKIPVEVYKYESLLKEKIDLFKDNTDNYIKPLLEIIKFSVGSNPRAIKRLINYYSLNMRVMALDQTLMNDKKYQALMLSVICMQLSSQPLYILLIKYKHDEEKILELITQTTEEDISFDNQLHEELEHFNYGTVYDEEIEYNLKKYERFLQLTHDLLNSLYFNDESGKLGISENEELSTDHLTDFINILGYSETTSSGEKTDTIENVRTFGDEEEISLQDFYKERYKYKIQRKSISLKQIDGSLKENMEPKYAFSVVINDLLRDINNQEIYLERLSNPQFLIENNVPESVAKEAKIIEKDDTKYPKCATIYIPEKNKKLKLGYHYNAEAGLDAIYRILYAVTENEYDYNRLKFKVRSIK